MGTQITKLNHMNTADSIEQGDKCFIFAKFPLDPVLFSQLPITIYPGVHFISTPQHVFGNAGGKYIGKEENIALAEWVSPGFFLKFGVCNGCVKIDASIPIERRDRMFRTAIASLIIVKPLFVNVSGAFIYGDDENGFLGIEPEKLDYRSNVSLDWFKNISFIYDLLDYNETDFETAGKIYSRVLHILDEGISNPRMFFNLHTFLQASLWERYICQGTLYLKLFPLIDSFSGNPPGKHSLKVSNRIGKFLSDCIYFHTENPIAEDLITNRLEYIWEIHRYPELHGHIKEPIAMQKTNQEAESLYLDTDTELKDLFDLFEISRLSLFKMLLLDASEYSAYSKIPVPLTGVNPKTVKKPNKERDLQATEFFGKAYINPKDLISYSPLTQI